MSKLHFECQLVSESMDRFQPVSDGQRQLPSGQGYDIHSVVTNCSF